MVNTDDGDTMQTNPTARVHDNKRAYTVTLNRHLILMERDDAGVVVFPSWSPFQVHWLRDISPDTRSPLPENVVGVLVAPYDVTVDDDPYWSASLIVSIMHDGLVGISSVYQTRGAVDDDGQMNLPMTSCTLPLPKLFSACLKVGAVVGWVTPESDTPRVVFDEIGMRPLHPDDVATFTGIRRNKDRPGMFSPATLQQCRELVAEHKSTKQNGALFRGFEIGEMPTQREFVAKHLGYSLSNIQTIITRAMRELDATTTTKGVTK
jgi:hypothetical protein